MKRMLCFLGLVTICFSSALALGADKVVVIPLFGGEKPTGNAAAFEVLKGKTFSNASGIGIMGIRPPTPVEKTGQTVSFTPDDDGAYEKGVGWPSPRFSLGLRFEGYTDYTTGLVWYYSTLPVHQHPKKYEWLDALSVCEDLSNPPEIGAPDIIDWRLPNVKEMLSLIDYGQSDPPVLPSDNPIEAIQSEHGDYYWTSTTRTVSIPALPDNIDAYTISFRYGTLTSAPKVQFDVIPPGEHYVLCVRGPYFTPQ